MSKPYALMTAKELITVLDNQRVASDNCLYVCEDLYYATEFMLKNTAGGLVGAILDKWNPEKPTVLYWRNHMIRIKENE